MNGLLERVFRTERRVLVLRGQQANWSLWRGERCVDSRESHSGIAADGASDSDKLVCPWPARGATLIDVVADSPLDEIDQVMAAETTDEVERRSSAQRRLTQYLLRNRLRWRHRSEGVRIAPADATPVLGALLRAELPTLWQERLESLQSGSVTVRRLHSAIRLYRSPSTGGDVLQVIVAGGVERHIHYCGDCPLFTRVVTPREPAGSRDAVEETLAHVLTRFGRAAPRVERIEDDRGMQLARRALSARGEQLASPLLEKQRSHIENRRLHLMTGMTALIACIAVVIASIHGVDSARERARAIAEQEALQDRVESIRRRIDASHATPERAAESLAFIDAHADEQPPQPVNVLRRFASVLSEHPGIMLDRLSWNVRPSGVSGNDIGESDGLWLARPADLPPSPLILSNTAVADNGLPSQRFEFALEVSGRVVSEESRDGAVEAARSATTIGDRQRRFEAFVDALEVITRAESIHVQISPVTAASKGGQPAVLPGVDFALRLRYTEA